MENLFQKLCRILTNHRFRRCYAYNEEYGEYYYSCCICRKHFWNEKRPKKLPGRRDPNER